MPNPDEILKALEAVVDPEIGYNVVDLGLVYDVDIEGDKVLVTMTLTAPGCPMAATITEQARAAASAVPGVGDVHVELVWEPHWTPERMSPRLKKMQEMGIL
ncbi:MAG: metal-sulfur cluster assembly factor [Symbiobacteriia bacterium]